ncbi:MAG: formyltetrahydrofolate deformylase [Pseudomonadales bacterium]
MAPKHTFTLNVTCNDRPGIVASVSRVLFEVGANVTELQEYNDPITKRFFMRIVFDVPAEGAGKSAVEAALLPVAQQFDLDWRLNDARQAKKVIIMVSQQDHCMRDLLYRTHIGELLMDVVAIVSNHAQPTQSDPLTENIPFYHLPVGKNTKPQQEAQIKELVNSTGADFVVLARYMQILSDDLTEFLAQRCVNIHHSSLPGFKGAKPYHQAYERGVKLIGATAHFVTADLDEGPIIEQDVEHITHADLPADLVRKGRDIERRVLARAVSFLLQDRVFVNGQKTVVFRN